jgi:hypothetical protein
MVISFTFRACMHEGKTSIECYLADQKPEEKKHGGQADRGELVLGMG